MNDPVMAFAFSEFKSARNRLQGTSSRKTAEGHNKGFDDGIRQFPTTEYVGRLQLGDEYK